MLNSFFKNKGPLDYFPLCVSVYVMKKKKSLKPLT